MVANNHILVDDEIKKYLLKKKLCDNETMNSTLHRLLKLNISKRDVK